MPQCPHCQTPYETGQRYCSVCGSFLMHPEQGDTFCPQCGVRVSPRQEFCHECDAPLKGEAAESAKIPPEEPATAAAAAPGPGPVPAPGMQPWVIGLLIGAGVIIIILLILVFSRGTPPTPTPVPPQVAAPAPAPSAPPPAAPKAPAAVAPGAPTQAVPAPAALKEQLQNVLATLREAQLHKDIIKFMSIYSLTYPELDDKRANTLKSWENYDYTNLVFTLDKIQPIDADNTIATVTWYVDVRNRRTQELSSSSQTYEVRFTKELGNWRIRAIEEVE
jgi:hypothetical protein